MSDATTTQSVLKPEQARFKTLFLENVRVFGRTATLELTDSRGDSSRWTLIVGENATGKSTLLESFYCLRPVRSSLGNERVHTPALFEFGFEDDHPFVGDAASSYGSFAYFGTVLQALIETQSYHSKDRVLGVRLVGNGEGSFQGFELSFMVYAYTAGRRVSEINLGSSEGRAQTSFLSLGLQNIPSPLEALLKTDYSKRLGGIGKISFEKLARIVTELLPDVDGIEARAEPNSSIPAIFFERSGAWTPAAQSGYGYLSTLAWVLDFAFKLAEAFPDLEDPLQAPAVCLVDEIDLHLHPKWQRTIVKTLLDTFPNVQFIVTAHSPIMVQASAGHNIVLLRRNEETGFVDIVNDVDEIANWRLDQILTSELFGFDSARPTEQAALMRERIGILSQPEVSESQKVRLEEIEAALKDVPRGDTADKVEMNRILDAALDRLKNPANWL